MGKKKAKKIRHLRLLLFVRSQTCRRHSDANPALRNVVLHALVMSIQTPRASVIHSRSLQTGLTCVLAKHLTQLDLDAGLCLKMNF